MKRWPRDIKRRHRWSVIKPFFLFLAALVPRPRSTQTEWRFVVSQRKLQKYHPLDETNLKFQGGVSRNPKTKQHSQMGCVVPTHMVCKPNSAHIIPKKNLAILILLCSTDRELWCPYPADRHMTEQLGSYLSRELEVGWLVRSPNIIRKHNEYSSCCRAKPECC